MNEEDVVGIFVGLESSSNEYIAYLIAPYQPEFPIEIGDLLLIKSTSSGQMVTRVMDYVPRGEFMTSMGERWLNEITSQGEIDAVGQDIKRSKISYRVRIKVLGSIYDGVFSPGLRRIPQITSKVSIPDKDEFKKIITGAVQGGEEGERESDDVYIGNHALNGDVRIYFNQSHLNSKRTFVFARAGYGKSNLMKIICREWRPDNGGLLVFDPEGEYAVTDKKGRPGIMDARGAILLTNQKVDDNLANVHRDIKLDLRTVSHKMAIPILVTPEKHENVFFNKVMGMERNVWSRLVSLLHDKGWNTGQQEINELITRNHQDGFGDDQNGRSVVTQAIINNLVPAVQRLHSPGSNTLDIVKNALRRGEVVIFDISRIDSQTARDVSSIIIKSVFEENKSNFIKHGGNNLIKATFVLEEAHTVLSESYRGAPSAFVELAKEGRKYSLGGIFITQQPGSIPPEIVSQGDNFFVFHLLSKADLKSLSNANAHYSDDIITQILNEPIRGKSYMWTSHQPFVIPITVRNFEDPELATPNKSIDIQNDNNILNDIVDGLVRESNDPLLMSIRDKLYEVENDGGNGKEKTIRLYKKLTEDEKRYLKERNCLAPSYNDNDYAVSYRCYDSLRDHGSITGS